MVEIWIGSEKADYDGDIETQYSLTDFRDIGSGNLNTSYTIDLPNTDTNIRLLKYINSLSSIEEQSNLSRIYVNGTEIIRGNLIITNTSNNYTTILIKADAWLDAYKDISIIDLDLSTYNKTYNSTNVVASWTAAAGEFMRFPQVFYGKLDFATSTYWQASDFVPWFNVYKIIEKIFAGYTITSTFLAAAYFQSLYVSAKEAVKDISFLEDMEMDMDAVNDDNYVAEAYEDTETKNTTLTSNPVIFNTINTQGRYDTTNDWYLIPATGTYRFQFTYEVDGDYGGMTLNSTTYTVAIKKNTGGSVSTLVDITGITNSITGTIDTGYIHLVTGDKIYCYVTMTMNITNNLGDPSYSRIDITDQSTFYAFNDVRCLHPGLGLTIVPDEWLQDIKQIDFIAGIKKLFNLVIWLDSWSKTIYIEPVPTFFTSNVKDISSRIDYTNIEQELISRNYTSTIKLQFKNDSNDYLLSQYNLQNLTQLGQKTINLTSAYTIQDITNIEMLFSTFAKSVPGDGRGVDSICTIFRIVDPQVEPSERPESFNMKIAEWKGYNASAGFWWYEESLLSDYPQIDALDLATLYPTYFAKTFHLIDKGKIITLEGVADMQEIQQLNTVVSSSSTEGFRCLYKFYYQNEYHYGILNRYSTNGVRFKAELTLII